jgi:EAL domain-containing protein (putative c-di-GMP-specific phosphodiesterase class I)
VLRPQTEAPGETAGSLGAQVLSLLPALRLHSLSIFDAKGEVQWLSEGALGPDEQSVVEEAIAALTATATRAHHEAALADNRAALFLAVRTPRAALAGLVMLLMDAKTLNTGNLAARVLTTNMRSALQRIALLLAPPPPLGATGTLSGIRPFSSGTVPLEVAVMPVATAGETANASALQDSLEWLPTRPVSDEAQALAILEPEFKAEPLSVPTTDEVEALPTAAVGAPMLRLRELIRLRAGGRTRRYQVVPQAEQQRGDALATLNELLAWLQKNPKVLQGDPLSFTICVSAEYLSDAGLPAALARALKGAALDPGIIGFELREAACLSHRPLVERFLAQCEQSRCFVVIDDFTFNTAVLDLLRSSAVRLLKVETRLVAMALRDKLAQARVVAIAQAAKVLGTLCAAKYVEAPASRQWLAAVGFDFTQSLTTQPLQRLAEPHSS